MSAVAIDAHAHTTVTFERNGVLALVVRRQRSVVAPMKLDEMPGCATESAGEVLRWNLRAAGADEDE